MPKMKALLAALAILLCIAVPWFVALQFRPSHEGFSYDGHITTWLLLAPIFLEPGQSGADAVDNEQIQGESNLSPQAGHHVKVAKTDLAWTEYRTRDFYIDFNEFLGKQTEHCVGYAVCYIHAERDMTDVVFKIGSDDQAKVYLNGHKIIDSVLVRGMDKDQNFANVILKRGDNVLVFKVINELGFWAGCARFTDREGKPMRNLKVSLTGESDRNEGATSVSNP